MPYLILVIGVLIGALALYMWFLNSQTNHVKTALRLLFYSLFALLLLFFAFTGRILISIGLLVLYFPFLLMNIRNKRKHQDIPEIKIIEEVEIIEEEEEKENEHENENNGKDQE